MKLSILIITLNEEHYIGRLLESLAWQTYKDFEVILVDGNSKDKTVEVAQSYSNQLDLHIYRLNACGISMQRNFAASKATTPHLVFFDADTILIPTFLETISQKVQEKKPDILTSWNEPISNNLIDHLIFFVFNVHMSITQYFNPGAVGTFIYAYQPAFKRVGGFSTELNVAEDFELAKKIFDTHGKYVLLTSPHIKFSVRRLIKYGRLKFIKDNLYRAFHLYLRNGLYDKEKFKYETGNHIKV
jgi:glycosyltransferase involved in cell wall biosynthesis